MRLGLPALLVALSAGAATAQTCRIDLAVVETRIAELEPSHGMVLSDIGCDAPTVPAHILMCSAAEEPNAPLWRMGRLDDLAWIYAVENATGQDVDETKPPRDQDFLARRDACTDEACLCDALIDHTTTPASAAPRPTRSDRRFSRRKPIARGVRVIGLVPSFSATGAAARNPRHIDEALALNRMEGVGRAVPLQPPDAGVRQMRARDQPAL